MKRYFAWIEYAGQWGGDTTIDAMTAGAAAIAAEKWARHGAYDAGDFVTVNVMAEQDPMPSPLVAEVSRTFIVE